MRASTDLRHAARLADSVQRAADGMDGASLRLEQAFLRASDVIVAVATTSSELVTVSEHVAEVAVGKRSGSVVAAAAAVVREPLAFLAESVQRMRRAVALLDGQHDQLRRTLRWERELRTVMAPMSYVRTLLRIEGANLDDAAANKLSDLGRDMEALQERLEQVFGSQFLVLHTTCNELGTLLERVHVQAEAHEIEAELRRSEIDAALERMDAGVRLSETRDTSLEDVSRALNAEVSRLVQALQVQDSVSQRLAHVRRTVEELRTPLQRVHDGRDRSGHDLRFIEKVGSVLLGQLCAAEHDLEQADVTVANSLAAIAARVAALDDETLGMSDLDAVSAGVDGFVQVMLDAMQHVSRLLATGTRVAHEAHAVVDPIRGAASDVGARLGTLAHGMHLVGLNAEVQAARIEGSGGLEVLSARTSGIARDTGALSISVARDIDVVTGSIAEVVSLLASVIDDGQRHGDFVRDGATDVEHRLHDFRDQAIRGVIRVGELTAVLHDQLGPLLDRRSWRDAFAFEMQGLRTALDALVAFARTAADELGVADDLHDIRVAQLLGRYTMASERRVHEQMLAGVAPDRDDAVHDASVALFDETDTSDGVASPGAVEDLDGDVVLF